MGASTTAQSLYFASTVSPTSMPGNGRLGKLRAARSDLSKRRALRSRLLPTPRHPRIHQSSIATTRMLSLRRLLQATTPHPLASLSLLISSTRSSTTSIPRLTSSIPRKHQTWRHPKARSTPLLASMPVKTPPTTRHDLLPTICIIRMYHYRLRPTLTLRHLTITRRTYLSTPIRIQLRMHILTLHHLSARLLRHPTSLLSRLFLPLMFHLQPPRSLLEENPSIALS